MVRILRRILVALAASTLVMLAGCDDKGDLPASGAGGSSAPSDVGATHEPSSSGTEGPDAKADGIEGDDGESGQGGGGSAESESEQHSMTAQLDFGMSFAEDPFADGLAGPYHVSVLGNRSFEPHSINLTLINNTSEQAENLSIVTEVTGEPLSPQEFGESPDEDHGGGDEGPTADPTADATQEPTQAATKQATEEASQTGEPAAFAQTAFTSAGTAIPITNVTTSRGTCSVDSMPSGGSRVRCQVGSLDTGEQVSIAMVVSQWLVFKLDIVVTSD
jgi:hypothetical protein